MDISRKRGCSRSASDRRKPAKRIQTEDALDSRFAADQQSLIAQTAFACGVSRESLSNAIVNLQKFPTDILPVPFGNKVRSERKTRKHREMEKPIEQQQRSSGNQSENPRSPFDHAANIMASNSMQNTTNRQRGTTNYGNSTLDSCFGFQVIRGAWAECFANFLPVDQDPVNELGQVNQNSLMQYNDPRYLSEINSDIPPILINPHADNFSHERSLPELLQPEQSLLCDDLLLMDPYTAYSLAQYPPLQQVQPSGNFQTVYPSFDSSLSTYSNLSNSSEHQAYNSETCFSSETERSPFVSGAEDDPHHESSTSIESEDNHDPIRPRRGPVDRLQTAQTRLNVACVRCKMQRLRCEPDLLDPKGVCLTCKKVSKPKLSKILCLRYRITDVRLFKQGYVPGHVWTTRFQATELDDIENWSSSEVRTIHITYDYSDKPLVLQVRKFKPREGDMLHRSWKHGSVKKSVMIPPYAIASFDAAEKTYKEYINRDGAQFFASTIDPKNGLLWGTMSAAIKASNCAMTEPERALLKMVLQLWIAGRFVCRSERICGPDTLGMRHDLIDETNPWLHNKIPIPPVMGAQADLIVTSRILAPLRAAMLDKLQKMILANKPQNWFCTYLCIFVLLHNCALMTQQDTAYAKKHGLETRFAMIDHVKELHHGANILLGYFHYCTKGFRPFSLAWNAEQSLSMAELNAEQTEFVKKTAAYVKTNKPRLKEVLEKECYDEDLYFVAQMYEEDWKPRETKYHAAAER